LDINLQGNSSGISIHGIVPFRLFKKAFSACTSVPLKDNGLISGDSFAVGMSLPLSGSSAFCHHCSGLMIPDTQIGGTLATQEVFNEKTTSFLYP
jgi:hypothetical protein